jgi:ABC-type glutathione transport system ATPase component
MSTNQALTFRFAEASDAPVNLMKSLHEQHHLSRLVISHDLAVVPHLAETIGVLYLGKLRKDSCRNCLRNYSNRRSRWFARPLSGIF